MTPTVEECTSLKGLFNKDHDDNMGRQGLVVELEESYHDLEVQFNIASSLLDMDGGELDDPLCHVGDWTQNQAKSIEKNRARTKKTTIHILVLTQHVKKLESFFEKPGTKKGH
ncbi:hypothetical protein V6N12_010592 [Hibiscus sabdariffa]|uniref:Uncharacterized protein n=1 Tax=Hibiscus sabdariffa TaxID=183260 RepID=A0ABR2EKJ3_9ROSI